MTDDLKPCPFCGGKAERITLGDEEPANKGGDVITCQSCGASSHVEFGRKENLVCAWNRRATPTVQEAAKVDSFDTLISEARAEAEKAMRRFPQPNYVISKVAEEAGEVVKAAIHCAEGRETTENVRGEMKQLIAMLYRLWVEGDQVHGLRAIAGESHD